MKAEDRSPSTGTEADGATLSEVSRRLHELLQRLEALENAKRPSPHVDLSSLEGVERFERLLGLLHGSIRDLADDNRDVHEKLGFLARMVGEREHLGSAGRGTGDGPAAIANLDGLTLRVLALEGEIERLRRLPHYRTADLVRRIVIAGSRVLRVLRGARQRWVRRRLHTRSPERGVVLGMRPAWDFPALAVVIPTDGASDETVKAARQALAGQTTRNWECVLWNRNTGSYRVWSSGGSCVAEGTARGAGELKIAVNAACFCTLSPPSVAPPATWFEVGLWAMAGEALAFVTLESEGGAGLQRLVSDSSGEGGMRPPQELIIAAKDVWSPTRTLDADALRGWARAADGGVVGKMLRCRGDNLGVPGHRLDWLRSFGLLPVAGHEEYMAVDHASQEGWKRKAYHVNEVLQEPAVRDSRLTVLVVVPSGSTGEGESMLPAFVSALASRFRFVVATVGEGVALTGATVEKLRGTTPYVYTIGEHLPEELHRSVFHHLVRTYEVEALLVLDGCEWSAGSPWLRGDFAGLRFVLWLTGGESGPGYSRLQGLVSGVDELVVSSRRMAVEILRSKSVPVAKLRYVRPGITSKKDGGAGDRARASDLRSELAIPDGTILVTMAARLVPENRPEDFVALANLLRGESDFHFLLVGAGERADSIARLSAPLGLGNFRLLANLRPTEELLAASDVVCLTAEGDSSLSFVLEGMAMGRPVVVTAASCSEIIEKDRDCGVFIERVGELGAFRDALLRLRSRAVREELGARGRRAAESFFGIEEPAEVLAAALDPGEGVQK